MFLYRGLDPNIDPAKFDRPVLNGVLPLAFLLQIYLTSVTILFINNIRTLGAHCFLNEGGEVTFSEQLLDSVNYTQWPLISELWAPVGLRYHGLHHMFAAMPYHNLGKAHAILMRELPSDSLYRLTISKSLWGTLRGLWNEAKLSEQRRKQPAETEPQRAVA
ncbi:MAG: fatty acid desaturase [Pirellulales bacterium]